jgi:hypothetical protein
MTDIPKLQLTADQQQQLLDAGKNIQTLRVHIEQLKRAGLPVENLQTQLNKAEALRLGMLREFGTG